MEPRLVSLDQGASVLSSCFLSLSLFVLMHVVEPNPLNTAVIKSLADAMDQINRKVKAVMLRVDECEKRLDAQQALSRAGGAFKSGGIKSDVSRLMEASEEPVKPDLSDQAAKDKTPNLLQHIASVSIPFGSVQRDAPAPKAVVRPSREIPTVGFELEEDDVNVGEARGEEHPELVEPRADCREEHLEDRNLELTCASWKGSITTDSAPFSSPRVGRPLPPPSPMARGRQMSPAISSDMGVCQLLNAQDGRDTLSQRIVVKALTTLSPFNPENSNDSSVCAKGCVCLATFGCVT